MASENQTEWLTFRASRSLVDAVDRLAHGDRRSRSFVLRELVREGVQAAVEDEDQVEDQEAGK